MSKDIIYKEDAIEVACRECHEFRGIFSRIEEGINELPSADTFEITKEALIEAIDNAKTVGDVVKNIINRPQMVSRPQGEWILPSTAEWVSFSKANFYKCSICGKRVNLLQMRNYNYCPNCGARMFAKDTNVPNTNGAHEADERAEKFYRKWKEKDDEDA